MVEAGAQEEEEEVVMYRQSRSNVSIKTVRDMAISVINAIIGDSRVAEKATSPQKKTIRQISQCC